MPGSLPPLMKGQASRRSVFVLTATVRNGSLPLV
jgi:hypothetical protein